MVSATRYQTVERRWHNTSYLLRYLTFESESSWLVVLWLGKVCRLGSELLVRSPLFFVKLQTRTNFNGFPSNQYMRSVQISQKACNALSTGFVCLSVSVSIHPCLSSFIFIGFSVITIFRFHEPMCQFATFLHLFFTVKHMLFDIVMWSAQNVICFVPNPLNLYDCWNINASVIVKFVFRTWLQFASPTLRGPLLTFRVVSSNTCSEFPYQIDA